MLPGDYEPFLMMFFKLIPTFYGLAGAGWPPAGPWFRMFELRCLFFCSICLTGEELNFYFCTKTEAEKFALSISLLSSPIRRVGANELFLNFAFCAYFGPYRFSTFFSLL